MLLYLGHPCAALTVANSDTQNKTGVYETVHIVYCDTGYVTPEINRTFTAECQNNGTWNATTCSGKYEYFHIFRTIILIPHSDLDLAQNSVDLGISFSMHNS